ncbi:hypothetical protein AM493_11510 [Flavobacterium akiainvivens]|uniref:DUF2797 domain-containing protein n=1 Tax=Flavobacterium akiainvivens TaxID=1202724 RepID=A0A0M9VID6_9FLAO|nr:DUF2797 domain-containing protein [Flavobacterium akiainvivens]KOS06590.1 hypothetical protein AM493_11510 [Flavobacterium akiainvivens]SFQ09767.1 Protein of unknown function [Flavobacterium akiainvivens]
MQYEGVLTKMQTQAGAPIQYYLVFEDSFIHMNQLLGQPLEINFLGYKCLNCGKKKKIYRNGFCYDCFYSSPAAGDWIMRPELSTAHLGIADRDLEYETKVQVQPHVVYLASSSDMKVGVTRKTQVPTRWIDQGASFATPLVEVPNRYLAGITEVALKAHFSDKINWKKMLLNDVAVIDLIARRNEVASLLPAEVQPYFETTPEKLYTLEYPVLEYPKKISSLNLSTTPFYSGKLMGIKGQYLIFEDGTVMNVRSFEGFVVSIAV